MATKQFLLRVPDEMRSRLEAMAEASGRSMTKEILVLLTKTMDQVEPELAAQPVVRMARMEARLNKLESRVSKLLGDKD